MIDRVDAFNVRNLVGRFGPLASVAAGLIAAPMLDHGSSQCLSQSQLGVSCPSCGLTRGVGALVRGDLGHSLAMNPIAVLLVAQAVLAALAFASGKEKLRNVTFSKLIPIALVFDAIALFATWGIRFADGTLPPP